MFPSSLVFALLLRLHPLADAVGIVGVQQAPAHHIGTQVAEHSEPPLPLSAMHRRATADQVTGVGPLGLTPRRTAS